VILSDLIKPVLNSKEVHHSVPYSEYCHVIYHHKENDKTTTSWKDYPKELVSKMFASKLSSSGDEILVAPFTKVRCVMVQCFYEICCIYRLAI